MLPAQRISYDRFEWDRLVAAGEAGRFLLDYEDAGPDEGVIPVHVIRGEREGPRLLVLAGVHGDEYEGIQTLISLQQRLRPADLRGALITVPMANVSSYLHGTRTSGTDGKNLAREFPGDPCGTSTQRLAYALNQALIAKADFLLDLHSGGTHYAMPLMVGYEEHPESEAGRRSKMAAEAFGVNVIWGHERVSPGRTVSMAAEYGVPWLYVEGYGGRRVREEEAEAYSQGTLRLLKHLDMLVEPDRWVACTSKPITYRLLGEGDLDAAPVAGQDGFFIPAVGLLEHVSKGQLIGVLHDWFGAPLQEIRAHQDGFVMMLRGTPSARKGDGLYALATRRVEA